MSKNKTKKFKNHIFPIINYWLRNICFSQTIFYITVLWMSKIHWFALFPSSLEPSYLGKFFSSLAIFFLTFLKTEQNLTFFRLPWLCRKEFLWENNIGWTGSCLSKSSWPSGCFKESDGCCSGSSGQNHGHESSVSSLSQVSVILCQKMLS